MRRAASRPRGGAGVRLAGREYDLTAKP